MGNKDKLYRPPSPVSVTFTTADLSTLSDIQTLNAQREKLGEQIDIAKKALAGCRQARLTAQDVLSNYGFLSWLRGTDDYVMAQDIFNEADINFKRAQSFLEQLRERQKILDDMLIRIEVSAVDKITGEYIPPTLTDEKGELVLSIYEIKQGMWQNALAAARAEKNQVTHWIDELRTLGSKLMHESDKNEKLKRDLFELEDELKLKPDTYTENEWHRLNNYQRAVDKFQNMSFFDRILDTIYGFLGIQTPKEKASKALETAQSNFRELIKDLDSHRKRTITEIRDSDAILKSDKQLAISLGEEIDASRALPELEDTIESLEKNLSIHIEDVRTGLLTRIEKKTEMGALKESTAANRIKKVLGNFLTTPTIISLNQLRLIIERNPAALTDMDLMILLRDVAEVYHEVDELLPTESFLSMNIDKQMAFYDDTIGENRERIDRLQSEEAELLALMEKLKADYAHYQKQCQKGLQSLKDGYALMVMLRELSKSTAASVEQKLAIPNVSKALQVKLDQVAANLPLHMTQVVTKAFDEWEQSENPTVRSFYILLDGDSPESLQQALASTYELSTLINVVLEQEEEGNRGFDQAYSSIEHFKIKIQRLAEPLRSSVLEVYNPAIEHFNQLPDGSSNAVVSAQLLQFKTEIDVPLLQAIDGFNEVMQAIDSLFIYHEFEQRLPYEEIAPSALQEAERLKTVISETSDRIEAIPGEISAFREKGVILSDEQEQARRRPPGVVFNPESIKKLIDECRKFTIQHAEIRVALKNFLSYPTAHMLIKLQSAMMSDLGYLKSQKILGLITKAGEAYPQVAELHAKALQEKGHDLAPQDNLKATLSELRNTSESNISEATPKQK